MTSTGAAQFIGNAVLQNFKPVVSRTPQEARRRMLNCYKQWMKYIPQLNFMYRLQLRDDELRDAIKRQFVKNAHVQDIRVIDVLLNRSDQELRSVKEAWTPGNVVMNVLFEDHLIKKPDDFMSKFLSGRD